MDTVSIGRLFEGFFVVAHRGASGYEPENTLRAVRRALEMGVDAVEVDVRLSADGVPVVIHDETLERTTSGRGRVRDYPVDELRMLDAGSGERIPLLAEVLDEVKGKAALFLELKEVEAAAPSLSLVEEKGMLGDVLFISLQPEALAEVRRMSPRAYLGLIYFKPGEWILEAKRLGCSFVLPHYRLATEKAVSFAHRLKLRVVAWTVDDPATAAELKKRGVDGVASNFPDRILPLRG